MADDAATETTAESVETEAQSETAQEPEAQPAEQEAQEAEGESPSGEDSPDEPKKNRVQERISSLTQRAKEAESRAEAAEREAREAQERLQYLSQQRPEVEDTPRPTLEQFEYDEAKYQEALDSWYEQRQTKAAQSAFLQQQQAALQMAQQRHKQATVQAFTERANVFAAEHEDFYPSLQTLQQTGVGPAIQQAVQNSDQGPAILYHLSKNPHVAQEINSLPPIRGVMELARLEAKLSQSVVPTTPQAPAPQKPVGSKAPVAKDPDKMSPDEYRKFREKQLAS